MHVAAATHRCFAVLSLHAYHVAHRHPSATAATAAAVLQVYMLLLGVTAMSLLTTPFVILAAVNLLIKEGHHQLYISGPRLRLSSAAGDAKLPTNHSPDWAVVMVDGQGAHGKTATTRITKEGRQSVHAAAADAGSRAKRPQRQQQQGQQ
jgi:hypothetical protein